MTIYGWDLSHYDLPSIGDAVGEGFCFFTHKAGGDANDAEIGTWWKDVQGLDPAKALLGAYWVLYPGSPNTKADLFLARLDATCPGWRNRPFILQVDCEKWNNDSGTVPGKADIKAFCDRLTAKMPKLTPIVYAPEWVYASKLTGLDYPLWASAYVSGSGAASKLYPGDGSSKWDAYSGQTPAVLQFTSSATIAGQTTCDANAYRGTLAQLTALVAPGWAEDMDLTAANLTAIAKANWNTDGIIEAPAGSLNADGSPNTYLAPKTFIKNLQNEVTALQAQVAKLAAATSPVITQDQLDQAMLNALKTLAGGQA